MKNDGWDFAAANGIKSFVCLGLQLYVFIQKKVFIHYFLMCLCCLFSWIVLLLYSYRYFAEATICSSTSSVFHQRVLTTTTTKFIVVVATTAATKPYHHLYLYKSTLATIFRYIHHRQSHPISQNCHNLIEEHNDASFPIRTSAGCVMFVGTCSDNMHWVHTYNNNCI